jgi:hypothetical protein
LHLTSPIEISRAEGAWYFSFAPVATLAEVVFHKSVEHQEIGRFNNCVSYQAFLADFTNEFHDLRGLQEFVDCLSPGGYVVSQDFAAHLLDIG